jgi:diguanylate cyclase (GGDEF)-like protein
VRHVAERLLTVLGDTVALARVGGDEFAALLIGINAADARLVLEAAASPVRLPIEGADVTVTVTCGAAVTMPAEEWPGTWMRADEALYMAKRRGRGGIGFAEQE